jgi:hypothetical protein
LQTNQIYSATDISNTSALPLSHPDIPFSGQDVPFFVPQNEQKTKASVAKYSCIDWIHFTKIYFGYELDEIAVKFEQ